MIEKCYSEGGDGRVNNNSTGPDPTSLKLSGKNDKDKIKDKIEKCENKKKLNQLTI